MIKISCGIYKITNLINKKIYIGQSIAISKRFKDHRNEPFNLNSKAYDYPLYRAIRKYGLENFSFEILEECKVEELNTKERQYILDLESANSEKGYNILIGTSHPIKLIPADIEKIQTLLLSTDIYQYEIASLFDISNQMVSSINTGQSWRNDSLDYPLRKNQLLCSCGEEITRHSSSGYCSKCSSKHQRKVERPERDELKKIIREKSFSEIGRIFDVSDNTIRKWCVSLSLPKLKQEIKTYSDEEWSLI